jgi:cytochrome c553
VTDHGAFWRVCNVRIFLIIFVFLAAIRAGFAAPQEGNRTDQAAEWNSADGQKVEALLKRGNSENGRVVYEICVPCHLPNGAGVPDGSIPQLAGQHVTVLIKQIHDIRTGLRVAPTMQATALKLPDGQALADVAAHLQRLCVPLEHGVYDGKDAAEVIAKGKALYEKDCLICHGPNGQGNRDEFFPALAGQHYKYLLRQATEMRDGKRRNAKPEMLKIIKGYDDRQLVAVSAYQATLVKPGAMCAARTGSAKK